MCPSPVSISGDPGAGSRSRGLGALACGAGVGAAGRPQYPAQQPAEHEPQHGGDEQPDDDLARGVPRHQLSSWIANVTRRLLAAPSGGGVVADGSPLPAPTTVSWSGLTPRRSSSSTTAWARTSLKAIASASVPVGIAMWPVTVEPQLGYAR